VNNYGNESNHDLFIGCGVVKDKNKGDDVAITLELDESIKAFEEKKEELDEFYHTQTFRVSAKLSDEGTKEFLAFCRYIVFEPEDEEDDAIQVARDVALDKFES